MIIPVKNYIIRFFNISKDQIESFELIKVDSGFEAHVKLKKNINDCPFCGGPVITHGYKKKKIKNDIFLESKDIIVWFARRYLCFLRHQKKHWIHLQCLLTPTQYFREAYL